MYPSAEVIYLISITLFSGYADAITDGVFMLPAEQEMTFSEFLAALKKSHSNRASNTPVYYIQKQNSNMTSELTALMNDVDADITWATEAFGEDHHFIAR